MSTIAEYNNNPGNIRPPKGVTYKGQIGIDDKGFAIFENYDYGRSALINDIQIKQKRGINTPHSFIDIYTPASKENPEQARDNYKIGMAEHLGLKNTSDPFPENSAEKIAEFIEKFESGKQTQKPQQKDNPNDPFAVGVPLADKARETSKTEETQKEPTESPANEIDPTKAALAGAAANLFLPMPFNPEVSPKIDTGKAQEANLSAQDKLELARRNLQQAVPQGVENLEESYREGQSVIERIKNEERLAQERLRALPRNAPTIESSTPSATDEVPSRTKAGASGAVNYVRAMSDEVPDVLAEQALNMRKDNPRGGQAIIDANTRALQKQADLGLGDYGLIRTEGGVQLALPPTTVVERQAEIEKQNQANQAELQQRAEQSRIQQESQDRALQERRLMNEAILENLRQARAEAGQRQNTLASQTRAAAPLKRTVTKAETDAEIARRKLARAQEQPNAFGRTLERVGVGSTKMGAIPRTVVGGGLGYIGLMSYQEALARFKAGDTSEGVLQALQAGSAGAAMLPPAGKALTKARGAGALSTIGLGGYQLGKRILKDDPSAE
jgi:hypothetical protein